MSALDLLDDPGTATGLTAPPQSADDAGDIDPEALALRARLFYAVKYADYYDVGPEMHTPLYGLMHDTIRALVCQHRAAAGPGAPFVFLDIGSGTGAECLPILSDYGASRMVAVDVCSEMHTLLAKKVEAVLGPAGVAKRCRFVNGDIAGKAANSDVLLAKAADLGQPGGYDIVVSALAIHHLRTAEKVAVYRRIARVLRPGGLFINADLFTFQSRTLAPAAEQFAMDYIDTQFTQPDEKNRLAWQTLGPLVIPMRQEWLDHYKKDNLPDPIEGPGDAGRLSGDAARGQAAMLTAAGFAEVACPFRYWELGILWAQR